MTHPPTKTSNQNNKHNKPTVMYFLFHSKRCGHCIHLVDYLENQPDGQKLVKEMKLNVVDMDELHKPENKKMLMHLQDLLKQVAGTPCLMRGSFDKSSGTFKTIPGDKPLLGKPMDVRSAYTSYVQALGY